MLRTLKDYHRRIEHGLAVIQRLCAADVPAIDDLEKARTALSQISIERSRFINQVVVPRMLVGATYASARDMVALQQSFAANRLVSNQHVADWTEATIAADWAGYRAAAARIWRMMEEQMRDEQSLVMRHLEHVSL
ncbi:hypothetical protein [Sphingomonas sp. BK235]|jgi:hypothetical protein|uniref:hypothetical protein n=1 Tax=Sphingomonas sp. BK235 TaxID=2512131 RepID=UPI001051D0A9|nr:hypothetical protein [Sphingomonas sp. BK235]TCP36625.1 hypothetical protein EV292_101121 [Sphingomonas sp. BK235]